MSAISSKAVAAKAAAKSAAEDLQGDTDESAAVTQSQMPVDVAAQLQQAQQLAQQQAADFKQNNEGSSARLEASSSITASAGSTLGLGTGDSSAADPTALSADDSTMDPAEKLQLAQQHQSQQAAAFKQNNEGTAARLDTASNAAAASAAAAAGTTTSQLESASREARGSSGDIGTSYNGLVAGEMPAKNRLSGLESIKSTSDAGLDGLDQTAKSADAKSLGKSADGSETSTGAAATSDAATMGASDSTNEASSSDSAATGGDSQLVAQSQEAGQQQAQRVSSVDQDASADAKTLPNSVSVTR